MSLANHAFQDFARLRNQLASILDGVAEVFSELNESDRCEQLHRARNEVLENRFRVVVMGEMKNGKSTLVNAFLGEALAPSQFGEACTAIPITFTYGQQRRALCFRRSSESPDETDPVREPDKFWRAVTIPPVSQRLGPGDVKTSLGLHPYEYAVVEMPSPLLQNGVEIEDSPGLRETREHSERTWAKVETSGAVLLVLDCGKLGKESDAEDVNGIKQKGRDPRVVFLVWNRFDEARKRNAAERVRVRGHAIAQEHGVPKENVHFVSAEEGLHAKESKDAALLQSSGVGLLEHSLSKFLMDKRAAAKLLPPLGEAERAVQEALLDVISARDAFLGGSVQRTAAMMHQSHEQHQHAKEVGDKLRTTVRQASKHVEREARVAVGELIEKLCSGVHVVAQNASVTNHEAIWEKEAQKRYLQRKISEWTTEQTELWDASRLTPIVRGHLSETLQTANRSLAELQDAKQRLASLYTSARAERQRATAALAATGAGADGEVPRYSETDRVSLRFDDDLLSGLSLSAGVIGATIGGAVLGVWLGLIVTASLLLWPAVVVGVIAGLMRAASAAKRLKARAATAAEESIRKHAKDLEEKIAEEVQKRSATIASEIDKQTEQILREIHELTVAIADQHHENEKHAKAYMLRASQWRSRLQGFASELDNLRREIDPSRNADRMAAHIAQVVESKMSDRFGDVQAAAAGRAPAPPAEPLDTETVGRFRTVCEHYVNAKLWSVDRESLLREWWQLLPQPGNGLAIRDIKVWQVVCSVAVARGAKQPQTKTEFRELWRDPTYQIEFARIARLIDLKMDKDQTVLDELADRGPSSGDHLLLELGSNLYKAYDRAEKGVSLRAGAAHLRPGTVNSKWESVPKDKAERNA